MLWRDQTIAQLWGERQSCALSLSSNLNLTISHTMNWRMSQELFAEVDSIQSIKTIAKNSWYWSRTNRWQQLAMSAMPVIKAIHHKVMTLERIGDELRRASMHCSPHTPPEEPVSDLSLQSALHDWLRETLQQLIAVFFSEQSSLHGTAYTAPTLSLSTPL